jgi:hypothetical protein
VTNVVEIAEAVIGVVISLIFTAVGVIIVLALYPINPFMADTGVILLVILGIAAVHRSIRSR